MPTFTFSIGQAFLLNTKACAWVTEAVNAHEVLEVFERNSTRIRGVVLEMIERFPADLDGLGARDALSVTRGDAGVATPEDIRIFETGL